MTPTAPPMLAPGTALPPSAATPVLSDEARLRESLKRCTPATIEAACAFRTSRDFALLPIIIRGVIARYVDPAQRAQLEKMDGDLRLVEDLALDSLTMMEIVMLTEEVFPVSISNDELRQLRTVSDVQHFIAAKLRGEVSVPTAPGTDAPAVASSQST